MLKNGVSQAFQRSLQLQKLETAIAFSEKKETPKPAIFLDGLAGSSFSFFISESFKQSEKPSLLIFNDKEEAAYN